MRLRVHTKLGERRRPRAKCSSELHVWNLSPIPCKWWVLEFRVLVLRFSFYFLGFRVHDLGPIWTTPITLKCAMHTISAYVVTGHPTC